jgi:hypothetical protein
MREYDIYLPATLNDGTPVEPAEIHRIREELIDAFGGYTHLKHRGDGAWRIGGVTFRDEVTIIRVLDDGTTPFDMMGFKKSLEVALKQQAVLIVARDVQVL